jgi:hypothetical protein
MWELASFLLDNLHRLVITREDSFSDMNKYADKIKSMYEEDPVLKQFDHVNQRRSIVDLYPNEEDSDFEIRGSILSRRNSNVPVVAPHPNVALMNSSVHSQVGGVEDWDNVANATASHDTLYSYHYMDDTDKTVST